MRKQCFTLLIVFLFCSSTVACATHEQGRGAIQPPSPSIQEQQFAPIKPSPRPPANTHNTTEGLPPKKQSSPEPLRKEDHLEQEPEATRVKKETKVKGIYVTAPNVANQTTFHQLLQLVKETELNGMVIDIKDDLGRLTYSSQTPLLIEIQEKQKAVIPDLKETLQTLQEEDIYSIARIVVFKDPLLAQKKPEWAIQQKNGKPWKDPKGLLWVDPYRQEVWDYTIQVAKEVAQLGFDEIQFDYVRFPDHPKRLNREAIFPTAQERSKADAIAQFLNYAKKELEGFPVVLSADVFGLTTTARDDMGIGQEWNKMIAHLDVISPMMYPSHYAKGSYGIRSPDDNPHQTIEEGLKDALEKNKEAASSLNQVARIRPWYQDFSFRKKYNREDVLAQIEAGRELGVEEFLLWNQGNRYSFR